MGSRLWTPAEETLLRVLYPRLPITEVAQHLQHSREAIAQKAKRLGLRQEPATTKAALATRPQSERKLAWESIPRYDQFSRLQGDFAICSDLHVPFLDPGALAAFLASAKRHGLSQCLILGDFFNQDDFSHWVQVGITPSDVQFKEELVYAAQAMELLLGTFKSVFCLRGNHDERILRVLRFGLDLEDVFRLLGRRSAEVLKAQLADRVQVSEYTFCHVNGRWLCAHPNTYSKIPGGVARDVAETEGMSTIMGNGHLLSMSRDKSDRYWAVDSGCLVDPLKVYYKTMGIKRFPKWQQGWVLLKRNVPLVVHRESAAAEWP